jgi:hypothetical protein
MSGHTLISNTDEKKSGFFYIDLMTLTSQWIVARLRLILPWLLRDFEFENFYNNKKWIKKPRKKKESFSEDKYFHHLAQEWKITCTSTIKAIFKFTNIDWYTQITHFAYPWNLDFHLPMPRSMSI